MLRINARIIEHNKFTFHYFLLQAIYVYVYNIRDILWHFTKLIRQSLIFLRRSLHCVTSSTYT